MRRPFGVEISPTDRARGREVLRDPNMQWASPEDARDFYARCIAEYALRGGTKPCGYWLYAFAVAARLHDVQVRKAFPPKPGSVIA